LRSLVSVILDVAALLGAGNGNPSETGAGSRVLACSTTTPFSRPCTAGGESELSSVRSGEFVAG
jgi:hypothetical protein